MILSIDHLTHYAFSQPSTNSVQYIRLSPRQDPVQRSLNWTIKGDGISTPWIDGFGNVVHTLVRAHRHDDIRLHVFGEVETQETHGVVPSSPTELPPRAFLRPTMLTAVDARVKDFALSLQALRAKGDLLALHAMMDAISEHVAYRPGETHIHSNASEVLELGSGVCQDHAHVFIACCRAWGIPARYVSGYLHTFADDGRHLATHAWAEAFLPDLGWVSFDPSNRQSATQAYVRLAVAFDYQGAAPIRGVRLGGGQEEMHVKVRVDFAEESQGQQ